MGLASIDQLCLGMAFENKERLTDVITKIARDLVEHAEILELIWIFRSYP